MNTRSFIHRPIYK